jgi:hypothetical protein
VVVIGAAAAYTIANANDAMVAKIAGEIVSNGSRRLGHQLVLGLEEINQAKDTTLVHAYKKAQILIKTAADNEVATLESVMELAKDLKSVSSYLNAMKLTIEKIAQSQQQVLNVHMQQKAKQLGRKPVKIVLSDLEKQASRLTPVSTPRVKKKGYRGYREYLNELPESDQSAFRSARRKIRGTSELQRLINGERTILDIYENLLAQYNWEIDIQAVLDYVEILKKAGLVTYE